MCLVDVLIQITTETDQYANTVILNKYKSQNNAINEIIKQKEIAYLAPKKGSTNSYLAPIGYTHKL